jgi:hypothetical protein
VYQARSNSLAVYHTIRFNRHIDATFSNERAWSQDFGMCKSPQLRTIVSDGFAFYSIYEERCDTELNVSWGPNQWTRCQFA